MIGFRFEGFLRVPFRREVFRGLPVFFMVACYRRHPAVSIAG